MATVTKVWTLEEVHSLPDDGNKYELVRGELFVTPPPTDPHETILARLSRLLEPFVAAHGLGYVYHPRSVMRFDGSEVEPDLMVRQPQPAEGASWDRAPIPILIVEVLSPSTRRRDQVQKRSLYVDARVEQYWLVDPERRTITVVRAGAADVVYADVAEWRPDEDELALTFRVSDLFEEPPNGAHG